MKKMTLILGLCLLLSSFWAAESKQLPTDLNTSKIYTGTILRQATTRLKQIEEIIYPELDKSNSANVQQLMQEAYALLELLPQDIDISVAKDERLSTRPTSPDDTDSNSKNPKLKPRLTPVPDRYPIEADIYEDLHASLALETEREGKLLLLQTAAESYRFSTQQIIGLLLALDHSFDRLSALRMIFPNSIDPENKARILGVFESYTDRDKALWLMRD